MVFGIRLFAGLLLYNKMCRVKTSNASANVMRWISPVSESPISDCGCSFFSWSCSFTLGNVYFSRLAPKNSLGYLLLPIVGLGSLLHDWDVTSGRSIHNGFSGVLLILLCMLSALLWKLCKPFYFFFLPSHLHQSHFRGVVIIAIQKDLGLHRLLHFCNCKQDFQW